MWGCRAGNQPDTPLLSPLAGGTVEVAKHIRSEDPPYGADRRGNGLLSASQRNARLGLTP